MNNQKLVITLASIALLIIIVKLWNAERLPQTIPPPSFEQYLKKIKSEQALTTRWYLAPSGDFAFGLRADGTVIWEKVITEK